MLIGTHIRNELVTHKSEAAQSVSQDEVLPVAA